MGNKIFMGGDAKSHELKAKLKKFFEQEGVEFIDLGVFENDQSDYNNIAREVSEKVEENDTTGILIFGKK
jgi:ribose 5-phosphate isomerase RpiB